MQYKAKVTVDKDKMSLEIGKKVVKSSRDLNFIAMCQGFLNWRDWRKALTPRDKATFKVNIDVPELTDKKK